MTKYMQLALDAYNNAYAKPDDLKMAEAEAWEFGASHRRDRRQYTHIATESLDIDPELFKRIPQDLLFSIRLYGVVEPPLIRIVGKGYEVISGRMRIACAKVVGYKEIACVVREMSVEQVNAIRSFQK